MNDSSSKLRDRTIELDGLSFHYREAGDTSSPAVVLLHQLGAKPDEFVPLVREFLSQRETP